MRPKNKQHKLDILFMDLADRIGLMSYATRAKVGAIVVKDDNIISMGWNGTPSGMDNCCEVLDENGVLTTKPEVLHAESNALMKLSAGSSVGASGATMYCTYSPCPECAKLIKQAKILRVVYRNVYRLTDGIDMLKNLNVQVDKI